MRAESLTFLETLMNTPSPSGSEQEAQRLIRRRQERYCDRVYGDVHGNLVMVRNEKAPLRVMLAGHVDEIGFMVRHIDERGFLSVSAIGGIDEATCAGRRVVLRGRRGPVPGVFGRKAIPLMNKDEQKKVLALDDLWIDIGARDRRDAERLVSIGDVAVLDAAFARLPNDRVVARGFDDRIGAFVVCEVLRQLAGRKLRVALYGVSTVQEELGMRGAVTSAYPVEPDVAIAVEVGFATDHPGMDPRLQGEIRLGAGPILHTGPNINPVVEKLLTDVARRRRIPVQRRAEPRATGTDANAIQLSRGGVATALVSVPDRYMHTPVEIVHLRDVERCADLLAAFVEGLSPEQDFRP
jgi:endoglucanase